MDQPIEHCGVIVVTVWAEGDRPEDLRARLTFSTGIWLGAARASSAAASLDGIVNAVRSWLDELVAR
jgi:hypothetical protein